MAAASESWTDYTACAPTSRAAVKGKTGPKLPPIKLGPKVIRQQGPKGRFHLSAAPRKPTVSRLSSPHAFSLGKNRVSLGPCWKVRQGRKGDVDGGSGKSSQAQSGTVWVCWLPWPDVPLWVATWDSGPLCGTRGPSKELVTSSDLPLSTPHVLLLIFRSNSNAHLQEILSDSLRQLIAPSPYFHSSLLLPFFFYFPHHICIHFSF